MYNRYIRNDQGTYTRIPEENGGRKPEQPPASRPPGRPEAPVAPHPPGRPEAPVAPHPPGHPEAPVAPHPPGQPEEPPPPRPPGQPESPRPANPPPRPDHAPPNPGGPPPRPGHQNPGPRGQRSDGLSGFLRHLLDQSHLESIDTGDLLLLAMLFLLFREKADEEVLAALGLLLIL